MSNSNDNKQPSVLSRSTLYAPLAAYHQTDVSARDYLSTVKSLPRTVGEAALYRFVGNASLHHHLTQESLHGKNTSARSLSENEVKDRLQQRGLTLVGGGFYSTPKKQNQSKNSQRRTRKRKLCHPRRCGKTMQIPEEVWKNEMDFVEKLNRKWNEYAWRMLRPATPPGKRSKPSLEVKDDDIPTIAKRAKLLSRTIEWVGSRVRLDRCTSCCESVGCEGILVADTKNTWEVFWRDVKQRPKSRLAIIPKQGSTVVVLLPLLSGETPVTSPNDQPELLCIVIEDNQS